MPNIFWAHFSILCADKKKYIFEKINNLSLHNNDIYAVVMYFIVHFNS